MTLASVAVGVYRNGTTVPHGHMAVSRFYLICLSCYAEASDSLDLAHKDPFGLVISLHIWWYSKTYVLRLHSSVAVKCVLSVSVLITATASALCAQNSRQPMTDNRGAAKLMAFTGQISYLRGSEPWALNVGDYVQPGQVIITGADGSGIFKVADGSTFEVFPKSKIVFRANSFNWEDLLELVLGKIKVQIEHPGGVPNNNKVRTPTAVISVRGTTFDVEYNADDQSTLVLDEEGSVEVARALRLDEKRLLGPNESIRVYKNESLARKMDTGGLLKRVFQSAMDAVTQQAINSRSNPGTGTGPSVPATTAPPPTSSGNHDNTVPPPAPPPPPPPAAPPAPPAP